MHRTVQVELLPERGQALFGRGLSQHFGRDVAGQQFDCSEDDDRDNLKRQKGDHQSFFSTMVRMGFMTAFCLRSLHYV